MRSNGAEGPELLLRVNRGTRTPLRAQIEEGVRAAIRDGRLAAGERLPSTRGLAADLGVARGVVVDAYAQLTAEGWLTSAAGSGTRAAALATPGHGRAGSPIGEARDAGGERDGDEGHDAGGERGERGGRDAGGEGGGRDAGGGRGERRSGREERGAGFRGAGRRGAGGPVAAGTGAASLVGAGEPTERARYDLRSGLPDLGAFPRAAWLRCLRRALDRLPNARLGYGDSRGTPELRGALAAYLARVRGVVADPDLLVICNGFAQGMALTTRTLRARGITRIAVEDPGGREHLSFLRANGMDPLPVAVDDEGIDTTALAAGGVGAAMVMPAHQNPTGAALSPARRAALLAWVADRDAFVLEDDYDAEYRYDREPVGALQARAPDRVIYGGSVSKTLAPAMRLGWLVAPPALVDDLVEAKRMDDYCTATLDQLALAELLASGAYDRHLRRTRRRYRARRDALLAALAAQLPQARVRGIAAGLQAVVELPPDVDEDALVAACARRSLLVYGLRTFRTGNRPMPPALVLGYGNQRETDLPAAVAIIADALAATG